MHYFGFIYEMGVQFVVNGVLSSISVHYRLHDYMKFTNCSYNRPTTIWRCGEGIGDQTFEWFLTPLERPLGSNQSELDVVEWKKYFNQSINHLYSDLGSRNHQ